MTNVPEPSAQAPVDPRAVRRTADDYVRRLAELNPLMATFLGIPVGEDLLPDLSPGGRTAMDELSRSTLSELDAVTSAADRAGGLSGDERRCARLLRERLEAELAISQRRRLPATPGERLVQVSRQAHRQDVRQVRDYLIEIGRAAPGDRRPHDHVAGAAELRDMLAELDDQFVSSEDVVEVSLPS